MNIKSILFENLTPKLLALCSAVFLWIVVISSTTKEVKIEIPVVFSNPPKNMKIISKSPLTIQTVLKGKAKDLVVSLNFSKPAANVSLADIKKGKNVVIISPENIDIKSSSIEVTSIEQTEITVIADEIVKKNVRLEIDMGSSIKENYYVSEKTSVKPNSVSIEGPANLIHKYSVWSKSFDYNGELPGDTVISISVSASEEEISRNPNLKDITVLPDSVSLHLKIEKLERKRFRIPVEIQGNRDSLTAVPDTLEVVLKGRSRYLRRTEEKDIRGYVQVNPGENTGDILYPVFKTPPNLKLVDYSPKKIILKRNFRLESSDG